MNTKILKIALPIVIIVILAGFFLIRYYDDIFRSKPSVFLISIDTLRPDHLGIYGYGKNTSPAIDDLARDGLLFENCFAQAPVTCSSCASILSGFHPHETKVFNNHILPDDVETLPKILKRQGYATVAVVSNYVLRKTRGFESSFDVYDDTMDDKEIVRSKPERIAKRTTNTAIGLLDANKDKSMFMWIHYQDPHGPYTPPEPYSSHFVQSSADPKELKVNETVTGVGGIPSYQYLEGFTDYDYYVSQYDGEIKYLDAEMKRFIDKLKELDLYDNSLIIFTSDHGEGMGERDYYFAHGEFLYKNLIHIPLIIKHGSELKGRRQDFVQHIDIVPTVLNILGIEPELNYRGLDLRQNIPPERGIFAEMMNSKKEYKYTVISNQAKLIFDLSREKYELYDLIKDPFEKSDLFGSPEYRKTTENLVNLLYEMIEEDLLDIKTSRKQKELSPEEIRKLKSLGYVQ